MPFSSQLAHSPLLGPFHQTELRFLFPPAFFPKGLCVEKYRASMLICFVSYKVKMESFRRRSSRPNVDAPVLSEPFPLCHRTCSTHPAPRRPSLGVLWRPRSCCHLSALVLPPPVVVPFASPALIPQSEGSFCHLPPVSSYQVVKCVCVCVFAALPLKR